MWNFSFPPFFAIPVIMATWPYWVGVALIMEGVGCSKSNIRRQSDLSF